MAIAYTTKKASGSAASGTSITITVPAGGFTAGNHLIVAATNQDDTYDISSISAGGNTYTQLLRQQDTPVSFSTVIIGSIYLASGLSAASTITVTTATSVGGEVSVYEFSGLDSAGANDKSAAAVINFDTAYDSGSTATTAQADELLFGINMLGGTSLSFTPGGSFTEIDEVAWFSSWKTQHQYQVVSATGAYNSTATASGDTKGIALIGTFKAATGGGGSAASYPLKRRSNAHLLAR